MSNSAAQPPHARLVQMATGCYLSRLVWAAASLGIADHLADGPKSAAELSGPTKCKVRSLHRFLRTLTNFGILTMGEDARFALTPLGEALKSNAPGFARSTILALAGQWGWKAWEELEYSIETGKPALEKALGMPVFEFLAKHPEEAAQFSEAMAAVHEAEPAAVAEAYDFSPMGVIVDAGGASGNMLAQILSRYPKARGILFDLPQATTQAPELFRSRGVEGRVAIEHGSFFERVPAGGDAYILSHVIHDWNEEQCLTILGNCRGAMKASSKLLLIESVLGEGNAPGFGSSDMVMMVFTGGEERTAGEYSDLLARAGLKMTRVIPTAGNPSIVEAERA